MSARSNRLKGNLGEATTRKRMEALGHTVLNGQMAESGVDLVLLCCQTLIEVKTQTWSALPSPKRRICAVVGDSWRLRGYPHFVVASALKAPRALSAGIKDNHASILYEAPDLLTTRCRTPRRTGAGATTVPSPDLEATNADTESFEAIALKDGAEAMSTTKLGESRTGYGNPDDIHRYFCRGNERMKYLGEARAWPGHAGYQHIHDALCTNPPYQAQAMRVDYRGKSLSDVMNEALVSGNCPLFRRPVR